MNNIQNIPLTLLKSVENNNEPNTDVKPYWDDKKEPSSINHTLFSILNPYNAPYVNFDKQIDDLFDSPPEGTMNEIKGKLEKFIMKSINKDDYGCDTNNELFLKDIVKNIEPTNLKNIYDVNFVKDLKMVSKFVYYRLLEIKKQIRLMNYAIETYKKIIVYIKWCEFNNANNIMKISNNVSVNMLFTYQANQKILEKILEDNVVNNEQAFLKNLLCRYASLKYILDKIQTGAYTKETETEKGPKETETEKGPKEKGPKEKGAEDEEKKEFIEDYAILFILPFLLPQNEMDNMIFVNKK
jgi:hypothetical protein